MDKQIRLVSFKYFAQKSKPKQLTSKTFAFQAFMKTVNPMQAQKSQQIKAMTIHQTTTDSTNNEKHDKNNNFNRNNRNTNKNKTTTL